MAIRIGIKNFRCLREVDWSPEGVCVLVGPNGSGKTTLFQALDFLRIGYEGSFPAAVSSIGPDHLVNVDAPSDEGITFTLSDQEYIWELAILRNAMNFRESLLDLRKKKLGKKPEVFSLGPGDLEIRFSPNTRVGRRDGWALGVAAQLQPEAVPQELPHLLQNYQCYRDYRIDELKYAGSPLSSEIKLQAAGRNAFTVLRNWRDRRETRPAYDYVISEIGKACPGVADDVEFEFAGQIISIRLVTFRHSPSLPVVSAPNGWLTALLHLMAVASAKPGSLIAFDDFENYLHPYAIRRLVEAFRASAAEKKLTIILAGHSLALLDEFREEPSQVYVMEPGQSPLPKRLTDYRKPEWLQHFSLGELYRHEEFGGPHPIKPGNAEAVSSS